MKKPLTVSIIIPVYNEQDYLVHCLDSIAAQTVRPNEVLIVDNNSTDDTVAIARTYPFVRVLSEKKQGVVFARNRGFNAAKSELLARIDADTQLPKDWVKQVRAVMRPTKIAAATGPVSYFDQLAPARNYALDHFIRKTLYVRAPTAPFLFGTNMVIRKSAWDSVKKLVCHTPDVHEDIDLAVHLYTQGLQIAYDKRMLAATSSRRWDDSPRQFAYYMKVFRDSWRVHGITSKAPVFASGVYLLGYVLFRPARLSYDVNTNTKSFSVRFRNRFKPRKHPMD